MLKKNDVIEILENGGHITINEIYRSATVYFEDCSDPAGVCRFDTAERLEKSAEYITKRGEAWSFTRRIYKAPAHYWDELSARVMAAVSDSFQALERAGVISNLEIEPISADQAAELSAALDSEEDPNALRCEVCGEPIAQDEEYCDDLGRVCCCHCFADRCHEQGQNDLPDVWKPAPGHVAVRDVETDEILEGPPKAIYRALCHRIRWGRRNGETANTWEPVGDPDTAVIDAAIFATACDQAAEEPLPMKIYVRADGEGTTFHASEARAWHTSGLDLIIHSRYSHTGVYVHGAAQKPAHITEDDNRAHCKHIALELDAYVNGDIRRCPDCGEEHRRDWSEVGEVFRCPSCGEISDPDDWEQLSVWDFLGDCYDIEYRVDSRRELRSVCVMVACGGPNIYLDTDSKDVELYWWSERARYPMSYEAVEALDDWAEEMWGCC